jgi:sugar lactone lactonase YvrE
MNKPCVLFLLGITAFFTPNACLAQGYTMTIVAGGNTVGPYVGPATNALVWHPSGMALDPAGNLYISEASASFVAQVGTDGIISIIAGISMQQPGFAGDGGLATNALLNFEPSFPAGLAIDSTGNLYIADTQNQRIRKVASDGTISTVAGTGSPFDGFDLGDGGPATSAHLLYPVGAAVDSAGNLYIVDSVQTTPAGLVRKVSPDGTITTVAGCMTQITCYTSLGDGGPATSANLNNPTAIAVDSGGNLYIADTGNNLIRQVSASGIITTVAGSGVAGFQGDGGQATSAQLSSPNGVAVDSAGNIYISDNVNRIRMVTPDGTITTISPSNLPGIVSGINGIALGNSGGIYVAEDAFGVLLLTPTAQ